MAESDDLQAATDTNAEGPRRVQVGNQSVEQHPIPDQIALETYRANQAAAATKSPAFGLRRSILRPGGCG